LLYTQSMPKKTKRKFPLSKLELLVAINGGAILVLEIIGSRVMAPFFGTSIYVWTAIIGVILFSLSIGYWYGGKLADKHASLRGLAIILLLAALLLSLELLLLPSVLEFFATSGLPLRASALFSALFIYTVPTSIMGLVSPYISKLAITDLKSTGVTVGRLFASGTIGSIIGTFLAGYWLTGAFSNEAINASIVVIFVLMAIYTDKSILKQNLFLSLAIVSLMLAYLVTKPANQQYVIYQQDTPYARYQVAERLYKGEPARLLLTDRLTIQSAEYLEDNGTPALTYLEQFTKTTKMFSESHDIDRVLVVGGGAYSLPKYLQDNFPDTSIDVAEIDGALLAIAEDYFGYEPTDKMTNFAQDGRILLNDTEKKYDIVYLDAFSSSQPPFQLSTIESFQEVYRVLNPNGLVVVNVIGSENGERSAYTAALKRTIDSVFAQSTAKATKDDKNTLQNIIFIAEKTSDNATSISAIDYGLDELTSTSHDPNGIVFTDSFSPVDRLIQ